MASNKEIRESVDALASTLGVDAGNTERMSKTSLLAKLDELNRQQADAQAASTAVDGASDGSEGGPPPGLSSPEPSLEQPSGPAAVDGASDGSEGGPPPPPPPTAERVVPRSSGPATTPGEAGYVVAPGKSVSCARGILGPGSEIAPQDLQAPYPNGIKVGGGADVLAGLVAKGYVVAT